MTDDTHLLTRRNALKGMAAFGGASAAGVGAVLYGSEPAAADGHLMSIDDVTIESVAEEDEPAEITELGISDLWFEVQWDNIEFGLFARFRLGLADGATMVTLDELDLGVEGEGTQTFGYGDAFEDSYDVLLSGFNIPLHTRPLADILDEYTVPPDEDEVTIPSAFQLEFLPATPVGSGDQYKDVAIGSTTSLFDITVKRVEPEADTSEGEAVIYGDD